MKYNWTANRVSYSIEITPDQLQLICDHDDTCDTIEETLSDRIDALEGLSETNYNGHFGPYIFVSIDFPDDTAQTRAKIDQLINDFIVHALLTASFPPSEDEEDDE